MMMTMRLVLRTLRTPVILSFKRLTPISPKFIATTTCIRTVENNGPPEKTSVANYVVSKKEGYGDELGELIGDANNIDPDNLLHDVGAELNVESIMMMNHAENDFDVDDIIGIDSNAPSNAIGDANNIDPDNLLHDVGAEMNVESIMMMNHAEKDFDVDDIIGIDSNAPNTTQSGYEVDDMLLEDVEMAKDEDVHLHDADAEMNVESIMMNSTNEESEEYEDYEDDYQQTDDEIRTQILSVALENVPFYGWTTQSIEKAVEVLELSPSSSDLFKRGAVDLVMFFIEEGNNALIEHLAKEAKKTNLTTEDARSEFIEKAIKTRLQMIIPYIDTWPDAMKLMSSPIATREIFENGANLLDEILYHAGDFSTDMSWYAKRGVLAAINVSTELHMLNDKSHDYQDTWAFLHRRMQDARMLHFAKDSVTNAASDTMALASAGISLAQNILGMNNKQR